MHFFRPGKINDRKASDDISTGCQDKHSTTVSSSLRKSVVEDYEAESDWWDDCYLSSK